MTYMPKLLAQFGPSSDSQHASKYEVIESIQTALRDGSGTIPIDGMVWSIVLLMTFVGSVKLFNLYRSRKLINGPYLIFHRMARANGLNIAQQWLLIRVARHQNLASPLTLMLSGATLAYHAQAVAAESPPRRGRLMLTHVDRVHRILFDQPMTSTSAPTPT